MCNWEGPYTITAWLLKVTCKTQRVPDKEIILHICKYFKRMWDKCIEWDFWPSDETKLAMQCEKSWAEE